MFDVPTCRKCLIETRKLMKIRYSQKKTSFTNLHNLEYIGIIRIIDLFV